MTIETLVTHRSGSEMTVTERKDLRRARRLAKILGVEFGLRLVVRKRGEFPFQIYFRNGSRVAHRNAYASLSELLRISECFSANPNVNRHETFA